MRSIKRTEIMRFIQFIELSPQQIFIERSQKRSHFFKLASINS